MNLDTSSRNYRQLVGNGLIYSIPRFQRDYSWTETEWEDLWLDIEALFEEDGEQEHYMGYLVFQSKDNRNFDVIDGQQRLTTLSILVLAFLGALKYLIDHNNEPDKNKQRLEQLRATFIGYIDPVTLVPKSKLKLNRNNDYIYQNYLVSLERAPRRNLKASEHLLRKAYEWFFDRTIDKFITSGSGGEGETLAQYLDNLSYKLFFTVITVDNELNAYKVFETLNARGVKLSSTDLLKNYLFSVVHNHGLDNRELEELDNRWEKMVGAIGSESLPDFLRAYWNSKNKFVRHAELFKRIRERIATKGQVFALMRELEKNAEVFAALPKSEDALWEQEQRKYIRTLRLFSVKQIYPLLLAAYNMLSTEDFTSLLRVSSVLSFRYNVIGNLPSNEQERVYNKLAFDLSNGEIGSLKELISSLSSLYVKDEKFKSDFSDKKIKTTNSRNKKIVRYILFEIEKKISGMDYDMESDSYSIEHIMPESIQDMWDEVDDQDHEQFVYRLGNMTLMLKSDNKSIGNADFQTKRNSYLKSEFKITNRVGKENNEWTPERISKHQKWMANQATSIWRIDQLS